jgi:hypothetical protein
VVNVLLNAIGIVAGVAGLWFLYEFVGGVLLVLSFFRQRQPAGLAGPAVLMVSLIGLFGLFVFGMLAGFCLMIAYWLLEPIRRWKQWRARAPRVQENR